MIEIKGKLNSAHRFTQITKIRKTRFIVISTTKFRNLGQYFELFFEAIFQPEKNIQLPREFMDHWNNQCFLLSPLAQILFDPYTNKIISINLAFSKLAGMDLPSLKKRIASSLFHNNLGFQTVFTEEVLEKGEAWSDQFELCVENKESDNTSEKNHHKNVEILAKRLFEEGRNLVLFIVQDRDRLRYYREQSDAQRHYHSGLTHWRRVQKVFQEFERENQLILNAAGEGIYGVDGEGQTTFFNAAAEKILGWKAEEIIGKAIHALIHHKHSDGSHYHEHECPIYAAFRDGAVHEVENEVFWSKAGLPIDVEYTSTPIWDQEHLVGAVVVFRDVTEKKRANEQLLAALQEVENLKQRLELENAYLQEEIRAEYNHREIVGSSPAIQHVIQQIELVAPTDATVLITGESGTGKELIARAIHEASDRHNRSLIRVNCAAIPRDLFESEFFGHLKGAFTGAVKDRPGRFELADGGTIFLDEVGEIPLELQGKLLRILQEQQFERVGESKTRSVDVRVIAATNRNLKELVQEKRFREDLYFRLNVFPIESVPLRERLDDVPMLAQHFINRASKQLNKPGLKISLAQIEILKQYDWPGNIRELENLIERQVILAQSGEVRFDELISRSVARNSVERKPEVSATEEVVTELKFKNMEKQNIVMALRKTQGKVFGVSGAAELLGVKPTTLASRIKKYHIETSQFKPQMNTAR